MIALKLTNTKDFMSHLLLTDTFDNFSFIEGEVVTFNTFTIDGYIQKEFFESEEKLPGVFLMEEYPGVLFSLIRGKRTPLSFKMVFSLSPENISVSSYRISSIFSRSLSKGCTSISNMRQVP